MVSLQRMDRAQAADEDAEVLYDLKSRKRERIELWILGLL